MEQKIVFMGDDRISSIPSKEDGSSLVNFLTEFPELTFTEEAIYEKRHFGRRRIGEMLVHAQDLLPSGVKFLIRECHRPLDKQKALWDARMKDLKKSFPKQTDEELFERCSRFIAPVNVAPYVTGAAVNLTLADEKTGKPLTMSETDTFTDAKYISRKARINRNKLAKAMKEAGFVNYPVWWWHWSYGDKYWAFMTKGENTIYDFKQQPS
ncbi:MAG: hypothetical protein LBR70_02190 [Lactobacillaceae bacterium]|jgi:D-alanyl-D-alanine dipeptidase|nr:hypothetical protein [Lactobacillaceae bacterium]